MTNTRKTILISAATFAVLIPALNISAQGENMGWYFNGSMGGTVPEDIKLKEFLGPVGSAKVKLDPGFHLGLAGGFNFNEFLGVEGETGVLANTIDQIGNASADAGLSHIPFLANVVLRFDHHNSRLVPYVAVGAGGDSSIIWFDHSLGVDGADSTIVFAYQLKAGLLFKINERMAAGVAYKYYHADSPNWDVHNSGGEIRFGEATVHAISAVFNMKF